jgi:16S rRNA (cytosine1402-N4)-methyltransferase
MDLRNEITAADILNHYKLDKLIQVFTDYGEEPFAERIAEKIVETRRKNPLQTTKELEAICFYSYPKSLRHQHRHPATRVFQALRIEVNQELTVLQKAMELGVQLLKPGGRMGIISFHSLEDRIVKNFFLDSDPSEFRILTKKPLIASEQEIALNRRARSAKLRIIERKGI